jgi:hypothetical protein
MDASEHAPSSAALVRGALNILSSTPNKRAPRALHLGDAHICMQMALLAYQTESYTKKTLKRWDISEDNVKFFDTNDTQATMVWSNCFCFLAFRGTEPDCPRDWLTNTKITRKTGPLEGNLQESYKCSFT